MRNFSNFFIFFGTTWSFLWKSLKNDSCHMQRGWGCAVRVEGVNLARQSVSKTVANVGYQSDTRSVVCWALLDEYEALAIRVCLEIYARCTSVGVESYMWSLLVDLSAAVEDATKGGMALPRRNPFIAERLDVKLEGGCCTDCGDSVLGNFCLRWFSDRDFLIFLLAWIV